MSTVTDRERGALHGLRVIDASVMPNLICGNTNATTVVNAGTALASSQACSGVTARGLGS